MKTINIKVKYLERALNILLHKGVSSDITSSSVMTNTCNHNCPMGRCELGEVYNKLNCGHVLNIKGMIQSIQNLL